MKRRRIDFELTLERARHADIVRAIDACSGKIARHAAIVRWLLYGMNEVADVAADNLQADLGEDDFVTYRISFEEKRLPQLFELANRTMKQHREILFRSLLIAGYRAEASGGAKAISLIARTYHEKAAPPAPLKNQDSNSHAIDDPTEEGAGEQPETLAKEEARPHFEPYNEEDEQMTNPEEDVVDDYSSTRESGTKDYSVNRLLDSIGD